MKARAGLWRAFGEASAGLDRPSWACEVEGGRDREGQREMGACCPSGVPGFCPPALCTGTCARVSTGFEPRSPV